MLFHQLIAGANVGGRHLFLRRELIFNDFKNPVEPRQRKDQHHHATYARRFNELLIAAAQIQQILAIALGLRMFLTANRHV